MESISPKRSSREGRSLRTDLAGEEKLACDIVREHVKTEVDFNLSTIKR